MYPNTTVDPSDRPTPFACASNSGERVRCAFVIITKLGEARVWADSPLFLLRSASAGIPAPRNCPSRCFAIGSLHQTGKTIGRKLQTLCHLLG